MSTGPAHWTLPLFEGNADDPAPIVINGVAAEATILGYSQSADEQGVFVRTAGAQHVPHAVIGSPGDPISRYGYEIELEIALDSEDILGILSRAPALASVGQLSAWVDVWITDVWLGTGSKTTFGLTRSTGYGSTGVTWARRAARCFVGTTEQTMVTGTPAAGECQLSQSADSTSIVLGTAPALGAVVEFRYYPVRIASAALEVDLADFNDGSATLSFTEKIPQRSYP